MRAGDRRGEYCKCDPTYSEFVERQRLVAVIGLQEIRRLRAENFNFINETFDGSSFFNGALHCLHFPVESVNH